MDLKIIFIGTPEFGAIVLNGLIQKGFKPVLVVTASDKPIGRKQIMTPPPVKVLAEEHCLNILQPNKIEDAKKEILSKDPDLIIVAAFGEKITKDILKIPKYGSLNVHPSLLPKYRGPSPIQEAILNGDKETGATIMLMDDKIDHGPIINQERTDIKNDETSKELSCRLASLGTKLLIKTIPLWINEEIKSKPQNDAEATFSKTLTKEDGRIDWQKPAKEIERQIRAFFPWPGSHALWKKNGKEIKIKIIKAEVSVSPKSFPIGAVVPIFSKAGVQAGDENLLVIEKLQQEGKKEIAIEDFLRGNSGFIGAVLI